MRIRPGNQRERSCFMLHNRKLPAQGKNCDEFNRKNDAGWKWDAESSAVGHALAIFRQSLALVVISRLRKFPTRAGRARLAVEPPSTRNASGPDRPLD
jgi:hypothetical protein